MKNAAGSSAKWLDVSAGRFPGWIASFAVRHGVPALAGPDGAPENSLIVTCDTHYVTFTAPDGAVAECHPPFPESLAWPAGGGDGPAGGADGPAGGADGPAGGADGPAGGADGPAGGADGPAGAADGPAGGVAPATITAAVAAHAALPRSVGVLLVRLGGYAAGVFTGYPAALADAKTGSRLVHGRSAAGGWSQHRFARRREKQANEALDAAADAAVLVFGRWGQGAGHRLDAVVLGGDKRAIAELRDEPRLAPYLAIATERFLTVPDPKRAVLEAAPKGFLAVKIRLTEP